MLNLKAKAKLPTENPLATNIYFDNSYSKEALSVLKEKKIRSPFRNL